MKFGTQLQFECPDDCPSGCRFAEDNLPSFNGLCGRCPVFICNSGETEQDKLYLPVLEPDHYRDDWAIEWVKFFESGRYPQLYL